MAFASTSFVIRLGYAQTDSLNQTGADGKRTGYWKIYGKTINRPQYHLDSLVEEGLYESGKKTGIWKTYHVNGKLKSEIEYKNNRPNGKFKTYSEKGFLEEEGTWKGIGYIGIFKRWWENGCIAQEKDFGSNGKAISYTYYFSGDTCGLKDIEYNVNSLFLYVAYNRKGEIIRSESYPVSNGNEKQYHISEVKQEMEFNKKDTSSLSYNPDGTIKKSYVKADEKTGDTIKVNHNKNMNTYYNWDCKCYKYLSVEEQNGYRKLYNELQQLKTDGEFKSGKLLNGKFYIYDKNGLLDKIEIYKNGKYVGDAQID